MQYGNMCGTIVSQKMNTDSWFVKWDNDYEEQDSYHESKLTKVGVEQCE
jgi:hypothetical protein